MKRVTDRGYLVLCRSRRARRWLRRLEGAGIAAFLVLLVWAAQS